ISLLNTAVIIKIANEYGFDAIVNPNMLFNPLVDLYLSSYLKNMRVLLDEIKYPTTPDKGFAFLPFGKVDEYITLIPNWINEIWKNISLSVKEYIEKRLSNLQFTDIYVETLKEYFEEHNKENISPEQLIEIPESNYWEYLWKEVGLDTPIRFICVGEKVDLTPYKIEELLRSYPTITFKNFRKDDNEKLENVKERVINEIKKIREFTKTKYDVNYQFYEFAVVMEYLKMKRKMISEEPRVNLDAWILRNNIYVKDKRALCNVCYSRPAIIFYTNNIMDKVPIKEDERLCPICLVKRVLATLSVKEGKLDKESPFIKVLLSVFQWIDKREEKDYLDAIERSIEEYYSKLVKVLENVLIKTNLPISVIEENILTIPSIDTISSMSFRLTAMKCMNEGFDREFWKILSELIRTLGESPSSVIRDKPPIRWIPNRNVFLFFIGGEWLIEEEIRRIAKERGKNIDDVLKQIRSLFKNINKSVEKCITESNHTVVRNLGKYLAIVRADGDNMGMLTSLSGKKYLKSIKQLILPEFSGYSRNFETYKDLINYTYFATPSYYSMISRTLSVIAKKVVESANEYYSIPIYSGGDDFLAISPSETSLQFSNKIRQIFSMDYLNVNEQNTIIAIPGLTGNATQSCTIHLMHVFTPLYRHLEESITELDEYAKYDETKNSFVVSYNPRKGGKIIAKLPWNINNIAYYILNLISITLDVPKIIMIGKGQTEISPIKMSDRAYRDLLDAYELNDKKLSSEIIKSLFEYEVNRHSEFGDFAKLSTLIPIRSIVDAQIKFKEETSNLLIEVVKATIALKNGMDSNPIMLGESI
ncbi:MAG: type III-B CRISPR-associated protein Cas10/Cmr2, partial [Nitrososphaeria archaeon]